MHRLKALQPGSEIGVVALGSPLSPERFELAEQTFAALGYRVKAPLHPSKYYDKLSGGFANGSAAERLQALHSLVDDPEVGAIITARGGYGILDMLAGIDLNRLADARKPIVGISDSTALLVQSGGPLAIPTIHGATAGDAFADYASRADAKASVDSLLRLLTDKDYRLSAECLVVRAGTAQGPVVAGNLTMIVALLGTPWEVDLRGKILVVEEVGEAPYRIHRLFMQLKLAGKLDQLSGLVLGRFSKCESKAGPTLEQVVEMLVSDMLGGSEFPVLADLPFGHWGENQALALGCPAEIKGGHFNVVESPLAA